MPILTESRFTGREADLPHGMQREIAVCLQRGVDFLLSQQHDDGFWQDFQLPVGPSTTWVTALIAYQLTQLCQGDATDAAVRATDWLQQAGADGRWGYNEKVEADADSTAWVLRLFHVLNIPAFVDVDFLLAHQRNDGGFSTYLAEDGWGASHACVTAAVLLALRPTGRDDVIDNAHRWLSAARRDNDVWSGYWWSGPFYPTLLAVQALGESRQSEEYQQLLSTLPGLSVIRSTFELACALSLAIITGEDVRLIQLLAERLCRLQRDDGGWPASACLRVTPHWLSSTEYLRPAELGNVYADNAGLISSVFACSALSLVVSL